ncbi:MAG: 4-hydroxybenzoate 3-monooxygenase [Gemmatimonadales bacterium]
MRTQVAIVGAGPAGLLLSHLLHREGIDSIVLEKRSRDYVEQRVRAGVLEPGTVDLLRDAGVGERLAREGLGHDGFEIRFDGHGHRIALTELVGRGITIYGQQEVVKDLIEARQRGGSALHFEVPDVAIDLAAERPIVRATVAGRPTAIESDFVAGCDGFHGICRDAIPPRAIRTFTREYPLAWVGILVAAAPSADELIYARHERGFALHSMRSPTVTRLYVQCEPHDTADEWPAQRIWDELHARLALPGWRLGEGPILEKSVTGMRSFVAEPMRHGRLFLAGDAAHIVPPTGAKGLNLALGDVQVLARGFSEWFRTGSSSELDRYSDARLARVWRAEEFSYQMTTLLHRFPDDHAGFDARLQLARLRSLVRSRVASTALAEEYVGL